jgi:hypothetical protein
MQDKRAERPESMQDRAAWVEPRVSRIEAGSAELLTGLIDDLADFS